MPQTSLLSYFTAKAAGENVTLPAIDHGHEKGSQRPAGISNENGNRNFSAFSKEAASDVIAHSDLSSEDSLSIDAVLLSNHPSTLSLEQPSTPPSSPPPTASKPELSNNLTYVSAFYSPRDISPSPHSFSPSPVRSIRRIEPPLQESSPPAFDFEHDADQNKEQPTIPLLSTPRRYSSTLQTLRDLTNTQATEDSPKTLAHPLNPLRRNPTPTTPSPRPHSPVPNIYTIEQISSIHLTALRTLTTSLLPLKYANDFYTSTLQPPSNTLTFTVLHNLPPATPSNKPSSRPIGWIRGRLDPQPTPSILSNHPSSRPIPSTSAPLVVKPQHALYIAVLALSASHRGQGLATDLLNKLTSPQTIQTYNIQYIYAHVWEENHNGITWYEKRGFRKWGGKVEGYYRKLKPGGAWIVRLDIS